jgi:multidrug efflux pump subunit AcrA (membrane-fusion protein)
VKPRSPFGPGLFRAAALARQNEPTPVPDPVPLPPLYGVALAALGLVLAAALAWVFWGRVDRLADGRGIVIRDSEFGIYEVAGTAGGQLAEVLVREGDIVQAGQTVARFDRTELQAQLAAAETMLAEWKKKAVETTKISELEFRIQDLRIRYEEDREVRAERAGRVVEVVVAVGNVIAPGKTLLRLESLTGPLEVLAYVSALEGKKVRPGMEVRVVPSTEPALAHGHLRGRVNYVSVYPVTREYLTSELGGNDRLADYLLADGSSIEVGIDLLEDTPAQKSREISGPNPKVETGVLVEAYVVLETVRPCSLIFGR